MSALTFLCMVVGVLLVFIAVARFSYSIIQYTDNMKRNDAFEDMLIKKDEEPGSKS